MKRMGVDTDEWYPVLSLVAAANAYEHCEVDESFIARVEAAFTEFAEVQKLLREVVGRD